MKKITLAEMLMITGARDGSKFSKRIVQKRARPAVALETLITEIDGVVETTNILDGTEMVVTGPAGEHYAVASDKFLKLYEEVEIGLYRTKPETVIAIMVNESLIFEAPWGGDMIAEPGDFIIYRSDTDSYRVEQSVFEVTYELQIGDLDENL